MTDIGEVAAEHGVIAFATPQCVIARLAADVTHQDVIACKAVDAVVTCASPEVIGAASVARFVTVQVVIAVIAVNPVATRAAFQDVVAGKAKQHVIAAVAQQPVVEPGAVDRVRSSQHSGLSGLYVADSQVVVEGGHIGVGAGCAPPKDTTFPEVRARKRAVNVADTVVGEAAVVVLDPVAVAKPDRGCVVGNGIAVPN